jgi:hypothetical protein
MKSAALERVPWVEPEDVAPLVVFLASDEAKMVSGTSFSAAGGDSAPDGVRESRRTHYGCQVTLVSGTDRQGARGRIALQAVNEWRDTPLVVIVI